jgi:hypothetical protein
LQVFFILWVRSGSCAKLPNGILSFDTQQSSHVATRSLLQFKQINRLAQSPEPLETDVQYSDLTKPNEEAQDPIDRLSHSQSLDDDNSVHHEVPLQYAWNSLRSDWKYHYNYAKHGMRSLAKPFSPHLWLHPGEV